MVNLTFAAATTFITDFNPAEDRIETPGFGFSDGVANPFSTGAMALVQVGADVVLRSSVDGNPLAGNPSVINVIVFRNQTLANMANVTFGDFAQDGSAPAGRVLTGTEGDDGIDFTVGARLVGPLIGGAGADTIHGLGGNDRIVAFWGRDTLFGDGGNDTIDGGQGSDTVHGGAGDDLLIGNLEGDMLYGDAGADYIELELRDQRDLIIDPEFFNAAYRGPAALLDGGDGNDALTVSFFAGAIRTQSLVTVNGGNGDDLITIRQIDYGAASAFEPGTISSPGLTIDVTLGAGRDTLSLNQFVLGSSAPIIVRDFNVAEDTLTFSFPFENLPANTNPFADGHARVVQDGADSVLYFDRTGGGNNYRASVRFVGLSLADLQRTSLGAYDLTAAPLVGSPLVQNGTPGDDILQNPNSAAAVFGTDGEYRYVGGAGNDRYLIDYRDTVTEAPGEGTDTITLTYNRYGVGVNYVLPANVENLRAGNAVANITGNELDNVIEGMLFGSDARNMTIDAGLGNDTIRAGAGDDSLTGGDGDDFISGGSGRDVLSGGDGRDFLIGDAGNDSLLGGAGNDELDGGAGNDTMDGGEGSDIYHVDSPGDVVSDSGTSGFDNVYTTSSITIGAGIEALEYSGTDSLVLGGNALNNRIIADAGNDTFIGGAGNDDLTGQRGIDEARWLTTTRAQATLDTSFYGVIRIGSPTEGFDTMRSVELFTFVDGTYSFQFRDPGSSVLLRDFGVGAGGWSSQSQFPRHVADMDGDGDLDIVGFGIAGTLVAYGTGIGTFGSTTLTISNFGQNQGWTSDSLFHRELADLNGDRKADVIGFGVSGTLVSLSGPNGYSTATVVVDNFGQAQGWSTQDAFARTTGDVNGDGKIDIVGFGVAGTYVALGNGDGTFKSANFMLDNFGTNQGWRSDNLFHRAVADVNGDGRADIVGFGAAGTLVALADGTGGFAAPFFASDNFGQSAGWSSQDSFARQVADINGDKRADIVGFGNSSTYVAFGLADGTFSKVATDVANFSKTSGWSSDDLYHRELGDINGDGAVDIIGFGQFGVIGGLAYWVDQIL